MDLSFWKNKKIFITGHTGFKGSWLSYILSLAKADITGFSLYPPTDPNLFNLCNLDNKINSVIGNVCNFNLLFETFEKCSPEFVIHLAAQPIVIESYINPKDTYETNVMGTINILECIRKTSCVKSFLNITTDKVYKNNEWERGYREEDILDGFDPYSNSKSCSELITGSYKNSFFYDGLVAISTARAGNVIGGGDFSKNRIIPDCVRAAQNGKQIIVRNPHSVRPYQHVLEPLMIYLTILEKQVSDNKLAGSYNIGPEDIDCIETRQLADLFCKYWGNGLTWENKYTDGPHEANFLKLDCSKLKKYLGYKPRWNIEKSIEKTVVWSKAYINKENICEIMEQQIKEFINL